MACLAVAGCSSSSGSGSSGSVAAPASSSASPSGSSGSSGRTSAEGTTIEVLVRRGSAAPPVQRTLSGAAAAPLLSLIDGLNPQHGGTVNCLTDTGFRDVVTVHRPSGDITVTVKPSPCPSVVEAEGGTTRRLDGASDLDRAVLGALGLPADYGTK